MLITPLPPCVWIRSSRFSAGSPKNLSAPCDSSARRLRWIAPALAAETFPYCVLNWSALSATYCNIERRSLRSRRSRPFSSAILKTMLSTPSCVSFNSSKRPSSSGPISDTVARTGCPCSLNTSQKTTGQASPLKLSILSSFACSTTFGLLPPDWLNPARSPFTSAMKTGTPRALKFSANVWRVTVFPVPVAPAIKPWRLAIFSSKKIGSFDCATRMGSAMAENFDFANSSAIVQHWSRAHSKHRGQRSRLQCTPAPGAEDEATDRKGHERSAHVDQDEWPGICFKSGEHRD